MKMETGNVYGRLFFVVAAFGFLWTGQAYSQSNDRQGMLAAPMVQYQFWEMGSLRISSPGGGFLFQRKEGEDLFNVMGFYTRHRMSEALTEDGSEVFHKISGVMNLKHEKHEGIALVKSESDEPFAGGLRTFNIGAAYGRTWFEGPHWSLLLGGGLVVGDFGNLPVIPIPFIRYKVDYPLVETTFEFMTGPSLIIKATPEKRFHGTAEISMEEFRNIRDLKFDVYAGYSLSDMAGLNVGIKNQSLNIDAAEEADDLDLSAYVVYGQLDIQIVQLTAGWALDGQVLEGNKRTGDLGDGFFISLIGMIPLKF